MANETNLEAALDKIAADNNLTSVNVGRMPVGDRVIYTANVHWDGSARSGNPCQQGHGATIREALCEAIKRAAFDRTPIPAPVDALPTMEAA